ncbi:hypothetical protein BH20ACT21_BH20ACT21_10110 [soil metagenome]
MNEANRIAPRTFRAAALGDLLSLRLLTQYASDLTQGSHSLLVHMRLQSGPLEHPISLLRERDSVVGRTLYLVEAPPSVRLTLELVKLPGSRPQGGFGVTRGMTLLAARRVLAEDDLMRLDETEGCGKEDRALDLGRVERSLGS